MPRSTVSRVSRRSLRRRTTSSKPRRTKSSVSSTARRRRPELRQNALPGGPKPNRGFGYCRIENTALAGARYFFALSATLFVGLRFAFLSIGVCAYSGLRFALRFAVSSLRSSPACRGFAIGRSLLRYRRSGTERSPRREARRVRLGSARSPYSGPRDPVRPLRGS